MSEQRWVISANPQEIKHPEAEQAADEGENVSSKAIRSIILKQIKNKLARSNNDLATVLKEGVLEKKSDSNITWAERFCVLDGKEFRYYYNEKDA
jgi:adenylate cyclase 10